LTLRLINVKRIADTAVKLGRHSSADEVPARRVMTWHGEHCRRAPCREVRCGASREVSAIHSPRRFRIGRVSCSRRSLRFSKVSPSSFY
jgi:hypothetical protein